MRELWNSSVNKNVPNRFYYLLFPKVEHANSTIPNRAFICSHEELASGKDILIYGINNEEITISRNQLILDPPLSQVSFLVKSLNNTIKSWGKSTDWKEVNFKYEQTSKTEYNAVLYIKLKNDQEEEFFYAIISGQPVPKKLLVSKRW